MKYKVLRKIDMANILFIFLKQKR